MRSETAGDRGLERALVALGRRMRNADLLRGGSLWVATTLGVWMAAFWADNLLRLPSGLRLPLVLVALGTTLASGWRHVGRGLLRRVTSQRAARELEERCGMQDNLLINACQFEASADPAWTGRLIQLAEVRAAGLDPAVVRRPAALRRVARIAGALAAVWALYVGAWPQRAGNAWERLTRPLSDTPPLGSVRITTDPAKDLVLYEGDSLRIEARIVGERYEPPVLRRGPSVRSGGVTSEQPMVAEREQGVFSADLRDLRESFGFSVATGGTWSRPVRVSVRTLPRVQASSFRVTPPAYLGRPTLDRPGVPQALAGPQGSTVRLSVRLNTAVASVEWRVGGRVVTLTAKDGAWQGDTTLERDGLYVLEATVDGDARRLRLAEGAVFIEPDTPPAVAIEGVEPNLRVWPGGEVALEVVASDDAGLRDVWLEARVASAGREAMLELHRWSHAGPPGLRGETRERWRLPIDPERFPPGETVVVEACARDWNPAGATARSLPLVLRVADPRATPAGATADPAGDALAQAIEAQRRALGLTRNLSLHLDEALAGGTLPRHRQSLTEQQTAAQKHGGAAVAALRNSNRAADARRLETLVRDEMGLALDAIGHLENTPRAALPERLTALSERQFYILNELTALLGQIRAKAALPSRDGAAPPPTATLPDAAERLTETLRDFIDVQKRIIRETLPLKSKGPDDLTDGEEDILGRLAREEARQADFLKDAVDDFSKLPQQDFADGSLANEFNTVYQEVEKAAAELYARKIELAVPLEQSGLENAEELVQNLERWLPDTPDHTKWLMEEPPDMPLPPMAELPKELEDIVGELLDDEQAMAEDVEDVSSSWSDSLDKGAGWDVGDGPMSDMSAKAVTGNLLPNQTEIGGRAGEGRSGRSHGQMVESEAEGKGGRQTPTRLTPSPFESGSVADRSEEDPGGATGGGKLSGFAGEGLRGPAPAPRLDKMARLAGKQAEIRQDAERLSLHLRAWQAPSGDIDTAVAAMRKLEAVARDGRGGSVRQAYQESVSSLQQARMAVASEAAVRRERAPMGRNQSEELWAGLREDLPSGYEEMAAAYFRRLAAEAAVPRAGE